MSEPLIYISCFGLHANELRVVQSVIQQLKQDHQPVALLSKPSMDTHILIADSPNGDFTQLLQTAKAIPVRVFFSTQVVQAKNTITVTKPPQARHLYEILKKILAKLMAMDIQHKRPIRAATPSPAPAPAATSTKAPLAASAIRPAREESKAEEIPTLSSSQKINKEHFFALIYRAKREKQCLRVKTHKGPTIFINGTNKTIWQKSDGSGDIEDVLASEPENLTVNTIHEITAEPEGQIYALDNYLWKSAILCSNGKILEGHVMDQPITLKAWPNFTRQSFDPMHLKMSALLAKESMSLNQISSLCQIPIEEVINFYNAAFAVDLIERRNKPREESEAKRKSTPVLKDMFTRLAKKLKIQ